MANGHQGVLHRHAVLRAYNTMLLLTFLDSLRDHISVRAKGASTTTVATLHIVIWDNLSFHQAALIRDWVTNNPRFSNIYLPAYSPFLNPIEEFFSAWPWKV